MKEYLFSLLQSNVNPGQGKNLVREYLQARILESLQRSGAMIPLAFHGGTALRFLYGIRRYSEDLDFALERPAAGYNFPDYLQAIQRDLTAEGYNLQIRFREQRVIHSAFVQFPGLLYELQLSGQPEESLAVKLEVDTNPPAGAGLDLSIVRRYVILRLQHHDRATLLAGKLHAILHRSYAKGRDLYDLLWYLSDPAWPNPNLEMLENALAQTSWTGPSPSSENWREIVCTRLRSLEWERVQNDVQPFIEQGRELELLTQENLLRVVGCELTMRNGEQPET